MSKKGPEHYLPAFGYSKGNSNHPGTQNTGEDVLHKRKTLGSDRQDLSPKEKINDDIYKRQRTLGEYRQDGQQQEKRHDSSKIEDSLSLLYRHIETVSTIDNQSQLGSALQKLKRSLQIYLRELRAINADILSLLDRALNMPLDKTKDKEFATLIGEELFNCIIDEMQAHLSEKDFNYILAHRGNKTYGLLQRAIIFGSQRVVAKTISLLSERSREYILENELSISAYNGMLPLQQAYIRGNRDIIAAITALFKGKWHKYLSCNLSKRTHSGFRILATVVKNGTPEDVDEIIALLLKKEHRDELNANINNTTSERFMILQTAIRSGSLKKVESVIRLLLLPGHEGSLRKNLINTTTDSYTTIACAFGNDSPEAVAIAKRILELFTESQNENILLDILDIPTKERSHFLQLALVTCNVEMVQLALNFLTKNHDLLKWCLGYRTNYGYRVLHEAYRSKNPNIIEKIANLLLLPEHREQLILNLENKTESGYTCLDDVLKIQDPEIFQDYINMAEKYLPRAKWQEILHSKEDGHNNLQFVVNSGNIEIVDIFLKAIRTAFGSKAERMLQEMAASMKLSSHPRAAKTKEMIARYLPRNLKQILQRNDHSPSLLCGLIARGSEMTIGEEFKAHLREIEKEIEKYPKGLMTFSPTSNFSHINEIFHFVKRNQRDNLAAAKIAQELFNIVWKQIIHRYPQRVNEVLGAILVDGRSLLQHAVETPFEEISTTLAKIYTSPGNEALLQKQLTSESTGKVRILQSAVMSGSEKNVELILNLLAPYDKELRENLGGRTKFGYMLLHDAVKKSPAILKMIVTVLSKPEYQTLLVENLRNRTNHGYSVLLDVLLSGYNENAILIINLSEKYLDRDVWQRRLGDIKAGENCLQIAVNNCNFDTVKALVDTIIRSYGKEAESVLNGLLKNKRKFSNSRGLYNKLLDYIEKEAFANAQASEIDVLPKTNVNVRTQNQEDTSTSNQTILNDIKDVSQKNDDTDMILHEAGDVDIEEKRKQKQKEEQIRIEKRKQKGKEKVVEVELSSHEQRFEGDYVAEDREEEDFYTTDVYEDMLFEEQAMEEEFTRTFADINYTNHEDRERQETSIIEQGFEASQLQGRNNRQLSTALPERAIEVQQATNSYAIAEKNNNRPVKTFSPCGGIDAKYLGGALPQLPIPDNAGDGNVDNIPMPVTYLQNFPFIKFHSLPKMKEKQLLLQHSINLPECQLDFYAMRAINPADQCTFVLAGRKEDALLPQSRNGRCILVLTQKEYEGLQKQLPQGCDVLVVKSLQCDSHGKYQNLTRPTARRLGIFLFAYHLNLPTFLMIDDNIKKIKANCRNAGWDSFYKLMENQLDSLYCVSVRTDSDSAPRPGELGSKMFMINMQELKKQLSALKHVFTLFPMAANETHWGEDYWMQLAFYVIANFKSQGYEILDKQLITLERSKSHQNAFASTGARARHFDEMDLDALHELDMERRHWVETVRLLLNDIISQNRRRYEKRKREIEKANLQEKHAIANQVERLNTLPEEQGDEIEGEFLGRYQTFMKSVRFKHGIFRHYQLGAMRAVSNVNGLLNRVILATGAGKTYLQCELMRMAYHTAGAGEHIIVVTPHIDLVKQFYDDFIEFNKKNSSTNKNLLIPSEAIIKVSSHKQSCHLQALLMNEEIASQKSILIFCSDSLEKFALEMDYQLPHVPLMLLDEYHYYPTAVQDLVKKLNPCPLIIGLTATPPEDDPLTTAYRYSRAQGVKEGYLAPVIADSLGVSYTKENVELLIQALPTILKAQYHPGFGDKTKLNDSKGIIYLPSIEHCERARVLLESKGITAFCIHSKNGKHKAELQEFLKSENPGVLLAVRMLRIGFNAKELGFAIIGQNADPDEHSSRSNIEQMIGRVMRLQDDKVGYILCFSNVLNEVVNPLLKNQPVTQSVNSDYLGQCNTYFAKGENIWEVCDVADAEKHNRLSNAKSNFKRRFLIRSQAIPNFQIEPDDLSDDESDEDTFDDTEDFTTMFHLGMHSVPLVESYMKSRKKKGPFREALEDSFGGLVSYLMYESEHEHKEKHRDSSAKI
ncbi:MAG: DEAD/DEAH box helicase family protein [Gammaproteobacteria bacterium]|nr:DEAD/DEAH box helicase family protein [Gammaproteobacteria bacterium]